ncbi:phosphoribosylglycinamide formyltransferase [Microbacter margulisiae]|uniref:Phosphoribosylglycinamide formyltransferase n=1 Tax=Microbacter margulisiae TaxID=1350067 RepID=A0A7W5DSB8_9PORP|nr:phosphoribosylglycinamide formyltransferase [Microbacter margulisiae]MBB3187348.1 phosphoribosylglycinamide formyltransferase-1 [Microbacter margulisiae]
MIKIAIFASGSGTNAENITRYFNNQEAIKVALIVSNNSNAYVLQRALQLNVPTEICLKHELLDSQLVLSLLKKYEVDWIILAGFLLKIPDYLLEAYPKRIINIHPALLPKFGGKGMYGHHVHQAVVDAGATESGITIHYVNERYDEGDIIFQAKCRVFASDTPDDVAAKIHELEQMHFPKVIEHVILSSV